MLVRGMGRWLLALLLSSGCVWAVEPDLTLQQLNHRAFTVKEGAPAPVEALAQTQDGMLWAGGAAGLTRFDGASFVHYPGPADPPLPSNNISALLASADGGLWIGFRLGGISLLRDGHLTSYGDREGLPAGTVKALALDHEGGLWVGTTSGLAHLHGATLERIASELITSTIGIFVDRRGTLWVATGVGVLALSPGASEFKEVWKQAFRQFREPAMNFAETVQGEVWAADAGRVTRLDSPGDLRGGNRTFSIAKGGRGLLIDHQGNVWISALREVMRWSRSQTQADLQSQLTLAHVETSGQLSAEPDVLLEDREHNIWVGTKDGLDRYSPTNVVNAAPDCGSEGYALAAGDAGTLWAACFDIHAPSGQLLELRDGRIASQHETDGFTAAYRDPTGTVWFAGSGILGRLAGATVKTTPLPEALQGFEVQALASDRSGALWVSVVRKGVYRVLNNQWVVYGGLDALPRSPAIVETVDPSGAIWFGYPGNRIARLGADGVVQVFDASAGLNVGNVMAIQVMGGQIYVGGELGFARFDGSRFVSIRAASGSFKGISGIVGTPDGAVWLNGAAGIFHIEGPELEHARRDPGYAVTCQMIDYLDGVPGPPIDLRPIPSAVATTDGRVWFDLHGGLIWIDTLHPVRNTLPPPVTIWSISSADRVYPNLDTTLQLPIRTTRLAIDYSAGSLTIPERVRFRYKLEGSDRDWQDAGGSRQALYTNLSPGRYTFRVIASNNDGVWNRAGASVDFMISPAFYQTSWFEVLSGLLGLATLIALFHLRMRHLSARIRARLEIRLAERERIARELHDTLLQGVQGLIWCFQAATDRIAPGEKVRELLQQSIERADRLLAESRDRVKDLRTRSSTVLELSQALKAEVEYMAHVGGAHFTTSVAGAVRDLHPIVREEVFLIAREALTNAFRHSQAQHIEAEISYGKAALAVRIRDDGHGIVPELSSSAALEDHFGLLGMRERAQKIRATLTVQSKPGLGSEIQLKVPADLAYRGSRRSRSLFAWRPPQGAQHE
jgi:signal transduction histidine kinase/ligand-binding sensor domain-containing protein